MTWEAQYQRGQYRRWPNEMLVSFVMRTFGLARGKTAVEFGCGAGANLKFLDDVGFTACGVDISETAVLYCKSRGLTAMRADVRETHLPSEIADLVCEVTCLQHLTQAEHVAALLEAHRLLRPGGVFWSYRLGFGTHYADVFPGNPPVWLATKDELREQLHDAGFAETSILEHNREYPKAKWAKYLMAEARKA